MGAVERDSCVAFLRPGVGVTAPRQLVDDHEADVVARPRVLGPGIPEPDDEAKVVDALRRSGGLGGRGRSAGAATASSAAPVAGGALDRDDDGIGWGDHREPGRQRDLAGGDVVADVERRDVDLEVLGQLPGRALDLERVGDDVDNTALLLDARRRRRP